MMLDFYRLNKNYAYLFKTCSSNCMPKYLLNNATMLAHTKNEHDLQYFTSRIKCIFSQ